MVFFFCWKQVNFNLLKTTYRILITSVYFSNDTVHSCRKLWRAWILKLLLKFYYVFCSCNISCGFESPWSQGLFDVTFAFSGFLPHSKDMHLRDRVTLNSELALGVNVNYCICYPYDDLAHGAPHLFWKGSWDNVRFLMDKGILRTLLLIMMLNSCGQCSYVYFSRYL